MKFIYDCDTCSEWHETDFAGFRYLLVHGWPFAIGITIGKKRISILPEKIFKNANR